MGLIQNFKNAWNAFVGKNENPNVIYKYKDLGYSSTYRMDRTIRTRGSERSIVMSIYNRIAIDCASNKFRHVKLDADGRFISEMNDSTLNNCLKVEANKDQTARAFIIDIVLSMLDEGVIAVVPIDTDINIDENNSYDILTMRVAKIVQWYPDHIDVEVYNDNKGIREKLTYAKSDVAIIENPFYSVCNSENSTLKRLIRKLNILDAIDEQSGSGKLDLIIQLPYVIKNETRKEQAEKRKNDIEEQLANSKYGIAYTDGTEHITQLNRPVDNNLLSQITYLTSMLFSQFGITQEILNGTADEKTMMNYIKRTVEPICLAITDEYTRKFLTKTARTQHQTVMFFNDPFKLVPIGILSEMVDKFTRNEIMSSNEIRQILGMKPIDDPVADELRNKNINVADNQEFASTREENVDDNINKLVEKYGGQNQNG